MNELESLTERLESLKKNYQELKEDSARLRAENSIFRITLLSEPSNAISITREYLTHLKSLWVDRPIDDILLFIDLLEKHTQVLAELAALKRKTISSEKIKARDLALVKDAEAVRAKQPKHVLASINRHEREREKVIKAWAKQFKITYAKATTMLEEMESQLKKG